MNFEHLFIRDVEGERRVAASELPLRIGTGTDSTLRLPGPGGAPVALLDLLDGAPFVQPVGRGTALQINGEPLESSRRLQDGDELQFFGSSIFVSVAEQRLLLEVRLEDSAYVTQPPEVTVADLPEEEAIAPTAFRRVAETTAQLAETRKSPLKMILGGGLTALLIASYLLFSAKSIEFDINPPEPDAFNVDGGWFRLPIGDRTLLRKGTYTVRVKKQGYYNVDQSFVVGDEPSMTLSLRMRKKPGQLLVMTDPPVDAIVTVNDAEVGKAPFGPLELEPGRHIVTVESARFLPFVDVIKMPGLEKLETVHVQLVPRWANVTVASEPAGAAILAGDEQVGVTPATIELLEGKHDITVSRDGYAAWDGSVIAAPNEPQSLPVIKLEPANATLLVNTIPRGANVTVNGRYRGQSPISLSLSPDIDYRIGMSKAGYGVTTRNLRLQSAASDSITVDLSARLGSITVKVQPLDATVYVDGRARGKGNTTVRLSSAPHKIEVRRSGFQTWTRTFTPRPGYPQTVIARLRSLEAIARDAVAQTVKTVAEQTLQRVEGGTFSMGASRSEMGRRANEVIVPVTITRPFLIGATEVTNKQFAAFRRNHDSGAAVHASLAADDNPVANVSWADAVQYCNWLSKQEGRTPAYVIEFDQWVPVYPIPDGYRLPTEAEWVLAMRYAGGKKASRFAWGDKWPPPPGVGNLADVSARALVPSILPAYDDGFASSAPVGKFKPNALGIYDVAGNVAEWVHDYYTVPTPGMTTPVVDPVGPDRGNSHVVRGSSWRHAGITELRQSYRDYSAKPRPDIGFRIARYAD